MKTHTEQNILKENSIMEQIRAYTTETLRKMYNNKEIDEKQGWVKSDDVLKAIQLAQKENQEIIVNLNVEIEKLKGVHNFIDKRAELVSLNGNEVIIRIPDTIKALELERKETTEKVKELKEEIDKPINHDIPEQTIDISTIKNIIDKIFSEDKT